jgi:hypothetical protein
MGNKMLKSGWLGSSVAERLVADVGAGLLVAVAIVALASAPWFLFWSVGVLVGVEIPLTFETWLAAWVFLFLVRGGGGST